MNSLQLDAGEPREEDSKDEMNDLWDEWNPTQTDLQGIDDIATVNNKPIKVESGGTKFSIFIVRAYQ